MRAESRPIVASNGSLGSSLRQTRGEEAPIGNDVGTSLEATGLEASRLQHAGIQLEERQPGLCTCRKPELMQLGVMTRLHSSSRRQIVSEHRELCTRWVSAWWKLQACGHLLASIASMSDSGQNCDCMWSCTSRTGFWTRQQPRDTWSATLTADGISVWSPVKAK